MTHTFLSLAAVAALSTSSSAFAAEVSGPWDVSSVEIQQIQDQRILMEIAEAPPCAVQTARPSMQLPNGIAEIGWDEIVNIGKRVWAIIEANKPVVNIGAVPVANALPRGLECWNQLEGWSAPKLASYEVVYKNGFGMEVVKFRFRLQYTYGGGKDGKGKYLANVAVRPAEVNVLWGYTFNANVEVQNVVNLGTTADPIAGLEMNLKWNVSTVFKQSDSSFHFFVQGDGVSQAQN